LRQTYLGGEVPCLEYEYVPGGDLASVVRDWSRRSRRPGPGLIALIVMRLAKILAFAHKLNPPIVHRDLKPSNVLAQQSQDGKLILRVADFGNGGVAASHAIRRALRGATQAEQQVAAIRGAWTSLYASPQQIRGADADPRDDVYALGVIWHQLLTGDLTAGRPGGTRWPQRLVEHGMAQPLVELLRACFQENPDDRPRHAGVLVEELATLLHADRSVDGPAGSAPATDGQAGVRRRITNSMNMTLAYIPAGTFRMGSPSSELERGDDEGPQHEVTFTRPFYMGIYPVTQGQFQAVMGHNPAYFNAAKGGGPDFPVENVSWEDACAFCDKLSSLPAERSAGRTYRLPTEAEWEYACRAGIPMPFSSGLSVSSREANFNGNYPYGQADRGPFLERTTKVGSYPPNPFGLFDMHGNVWEWCADYYHPNFYKNSPRYDPQGPPDGSLRVVRGGSCYNIGRFCRATYRFGITPGNRDIDVGLRVVMTLEM
jgi:formylglycine-generating enzyme required for sulfatase activity